MLIAERHPDAALALARSAAERAEYLELMLYLANSVQPALAFAPLAALATRVSARPAWQRVAAIEQLPDWP